MLWPSGSIFVAQLRDNTTVKQQAAPTATGQRHTKRCLSSDPEPALSINNRRRRSLDQMRKLQSTEQFRRYRSPLDRPIAPGHTLIESRATFQVWIDAIERCAGPVRQWPEKRPSCDRAGQIKPTIVGGRSQLSGRIPNKAAQQHGRRSDAVKPPPP